MDKVIQNFSVIRTTTKLNSFQQCTALKLTQVFYQDKKKLTKFSVKIPPIKLPNYDGDPMAYHDWINMFQATVDRNHTISDTHRMTYLQDSVSGKAKALKGNSCNPAFYKAALRDLQHHFGDSDYIVNAFIPQIETWPSSISNNRSVVSFAFFLKELVRTFQNLGFQADLNSTALLKLIKTKVPDNLLMKWTENAVRENVQNNKVQLFQEWLEIQAKVLERLQGEHTFLGTSAVKDQELKTQNQTSLGSKQNAKMGSDINTTTKFQYSSNKCFNCS